MLRAFESVTRLLRHRKNVPSRSPQVGIISSVTTSYLREWVKTGLFSSGVICITRQYGPAYRGKGYKTPEQGIRERVVVL